MEFDELSQNVIGCAIEVHRNLGPGLLESTYSSVWLVSSRTRAFRFRWSCRCPFVTKISCSIAAIGS